MSTQGNALNISQANPLSSLLGGTGESSAASLPAQVQKNSFNFATTAGSADAYTVTLSPVPGSLTNGLQVTLFANRTNTTVSPTLNVNGLGAVAIVTAAGYPLIGDIEQDDVYQLVYNSINNQFTLLNPSMTFAAATYVQSSYYLTAMDTGAANAYVATLPPNYSTIPTTLATYYVSITNDNTTTSTLNLNGSGPKVISNLQGAALTGGELLAGTIAQFIYNGTTYQLQNPANAIITGIVTLDGDTGTASGSIVDIVTDSLCGSSVVFVGNGDAAIQLGVTDSNNNTLIGNASGNYSISGSSNTGLGYSALAGLTDGNNNVAVGLYAGTALTSGSDCVAIGYQALMSSQTDSFNTAIGSSALMALMGGEQNIGIGGNALKLSVADSNNFAVGFNALVNLNGGSYNASIGTGTLAELLTGSYNIAIGSNGAGENYTGAESSNILFNNLGVVGESNTLRIGAGTGTSNEQLSTSFIAGINGVTNTSAKLVTINSTTDQLGVIASANNGVLITSNSGIPSLLANSGTPGYVLTANSGAPPSWQATGESLAVTQIDADAGDAVPTAGVLYLTGGTSGLTTSATASTVEITGVLNSANGGTGVDNGSNTLTINADSTINQDVSTAGSPTFVNPSANTFIPALQSIATAAGTTTLTVASEQVQEFTGTTTQIVVMPVVTTLSLGQPYTIYNNSSGIVTVNSSGGDLIEAMGPGTCLFMNCSLLTGTTAASWSASYVEAGGGGTVNSGLINQLAYYGADGTTVSGLATADSGVLVTDNSGVPSISDVLPSEVQLQIGSFDSGSGASSTTFWRGDGTWATGNFPSDGTFTPTVSFGGAATGLVYAAQQGNYTTIGGICVFAIYIQLTSKGISTGAATLAGLPFAGRSTAANQTLIGQMTGSSLQPLLATIVSSTESLTLTFQDDSGPFTVTDAYFENDTEIFISGCYLI